MGVQFVHLLHLCRVMQCRKHVSLSDPQVYVNYWLGTYFEIKKKYEIISVVPWEAGNYLRWVTRNYFFFTLQNMEDGSCCSQFMHAVFPSHHTYLQNWQNSCPRHMEFITQTLSILSQKNCGALSYSIKYLSTVASHDESQLSRKCKSLQNAVIYHSLGAFVEMISLMIWPHLSDLWPVFSFSLVNW